jgi:hypothetical protein
MPERVGVAVFGCGGVSNGHFGANASNPKARRLDHVLEGRASRRPLVPAGVSL